MWVSMAYRREGNLLIFERNEQRIKGLTLRLHIFLFHSCLSYFFFLHFIFPLLRECGRCWERRQVLSITHSFVAVLILFSRFTTSSCSSNTRVPLARLQRAPGRHLSNEPRFLSFPFLLPQPQSFLLSLFVRASAFLGIQCPLTLV